MSKNRKPEDKAPTPEIVKIPFGHWFNKQVQKNRLRDHQEEALIVFVKKQGLKLEEPEVVYEEMLRRF